MDNTYVPVTVVHYPNNPIKYFKRPNTNSNSTTTGRELNPPGYASKSI